MAPKTPKDIPYSPLLSSLNNKIRFQQSSLRLIRTWQHPFSRRLVDRSQHLEAFLFLLLHHSFPLKISKQKQPFDSPAIFTIFKSHSILVTVQRQSLHVQQYISNIRGLWRPSNAPLHFQIWHRALTYSRRVFDHFDFCES